MISGLAMIAVLVTGCAGDDAEPARFETAGATATLPSRTAVTTPAALAPPEGDLVVVDAVLDGDSLAVIRNGSRAEVRLAGINTPEADECYGDVARDVTRSLVTDAVTLVRVEGEADEDQFGRLLRNVWVGGTWINHELVAGGAAVAVQTGTADEAALVAAEDAAWQSGAGLWGSTVCGSFPDGLRITDIRHDPPGRDFENQNDEFVLFTNEGSDTIDVSGWIVRDESSTHRYRFPQGRTVAPGEGLRLRSGCGQDGGRDLYWCADDAVWSNGGDTVILQSSTGTVVDRWKYPGDF